MSFGWSASSSPPFSSIKPATANSFADALKRLAEHVEEKNKNIDTNNGGASGLVQSSTDFPNRINASHVNNSLPPEQALRLYTQYIQETERREDIRRCYFRTYGGSDGSNINLPTLNRRLDVIDPYRFMPPHLSSLLHPSAYLQSLTPQQRIPPPPPPPLPSPFLFPTIKTVDTIPRIPAQENVDKKSDESSRLSKPKSKLFRPYDLDSPNSNSHQTSPSSPTITKKSTPSPSTFPSSISVFPDESQTEISSGKEKQLFNSLGLVQQSTDVISEKSSFIDTSPSITISEDSTSIETISSQQDNHLDKSLSNIKDSSSSVKLKRKSVCSSKKSSNRKQLKIDTIDNTVE